MATLLERNGIPGSFRFFLKYKTKLFLQNSATLWDIPGMAYSSGSSVNSEFGLKVLFERLKLMKIMYKLTFDVMVMLGSLSVSVGPPKSHLRATLSPIIKNLKIHS